MIYHQTNYVLGKDASKKPMEETPKDAAIADGVKDLRLAQGIYSYFILHKLHYV